MAELVLTKIVSGIPSAPLRLSVKNTTRCLLSRSEQAGGEVQAKGEDDGVKDEGEQAVE